MADLLGGIVLLASGYYLEASFLNGDPSKYYYLLDIAGALLVLSGVFKLIKGKPA